MCQFCSKSGAKEERERWWREFREKRSEIPMGTNDGHRWCMTGAGSGQMTQLWWYRCEACGLVMQQWVENFDEEGKYAAAFSKNQRWNKGAMPNRMFHGGALPPICEEAVRA